MESKLKRMERKCRYLLEDRGICTLVFGYPQCPLLVDGNFSECPYYKSPEDEDEGGENFV
ncbi:MAG: hypothetical protein DRN91_09190 [Candidatus Alkanophagales archaeon]|nr:MAG: hypothetical protein DRN91_09190 [Candidatus Alkanophagales archaeon]